MLSGILLFHHAEALMLDNICRDNQHWGFVTTPECQTTPARDQLAAANTLQSNPRGAIMVTTNRWPISDDNTNFRTPLVNLAAASCCY